MANPSADDKDPRMVVSTRLVGPSMLGTSLTTGVLGGFGMSEKRQGSWREGIAIVFAVVVLLMLLGLMPWEHLG